MTCINRQALTRPPPKKETKPPLNPIPQSINKPTKQTKPHPQRVKRPKHKRKSPQPDWPSRPHAPHPRLSELRIVARPTWWPSATRVFQMTYLPRWGGNECLRPPTTKNLLDKEPFLKYLKVHHWAMRCPYSSSLKLTTNDLTSMIYFAF